MYTSMFRKAMLGDTATLNLDFTTTGVLDSRLTFTRASTATYINSSGYVTTAEANTPRFDYDPVTLAPRGLLIEGAAVNLAYRSNDFALTPSDGNNWNSSGYTADFTSTLLPDGSTGNARRLSMASGSGSYRSSSITVTASTTYTLSFWAQNNGGSQARYRVWNVSAGSSIVDYNLSGSNYVASIGGANNTSSTWVRISITFTTPAGCTSIFVYPCSSDSGTVDLLIWGAQLEAGAGASSYIPTVASQVTRNKDSMTLSDLSALGITNTAGTLVADFTNSTENSNYAGSLSFRSAAGSTYAARFRWATTAILTTYFQSNGSTGFTTNLNGSRTSFARCKAATSYSYDGTTTSVFGSMNGAAMSVTSTTTQAASIAIPTSLRWNDDGSTPNATDYPSMVMRSVKYYPTCLTIAQMNTLTTL